MSRIAAITLAATLFIAANASAAEYVVIVNNANPATSIRKDALAELFLKKTATWEHGEKVEPVDLDSRSPVRADFTKIVHGRSVAALLAYWKWKTFGGVEVPPVQKASDSQVLEFVRANPGAVGYISASTAPDRVKVLQVAE